MARNAYRALARIEREAEDLAEKIAREILDLIYVNAPRGSAARGTEHDDAGPILAESFYMRKDPATGDYTISSRRRYWVFVEFGTLKHGDRQPFIRPAIDEVKARYGR